MDLSDCICVVCGAPCLSADAELDRGAVQPDLIVCGACGRRYDVVHGVPCLLNLGARDYVALVEIAGEYDSPSYDFRRAGPMDDTWPTLLAARHETRDLKAFTSALPPHISLNALEDRYEQWREMHILSGNLDLAGKKVLVVGAGLGFDAHLILRRGAQVTAVDLNPHTNAFGAVQTPGARWIGALGRQLPFGDSAFDCVFISASLHHVLDVSATIVDMLRVLKVGGSLFTTNDSYSADATTDAEDARKWNDHQDVLRGINENTPRLKVFIDPILARWPALDVEFWTSRAYGAYTGADQQRTNILEPRQWDLARDNEMLRTTGGAIFMRVTKLAEAQLMRPAELFSYIGRKAELMARLAALAPPSFGWPAFPGEAGNTKLQVLNGWRWRTAEERGRQAYRLGRWLLNRAPEQSRLAIAVQAPSGAQAMVGFTVLVDGQEAIAFPVDRGRVKEVQIDAARLDANRAIAIEIRMDPVSDSFSDGLFQVTKLRFET